MKNRSYRSGAAASIPLHEEWWALYPTFSLLRSLQCWWWLNVDDLGEDGLDDDHVGNDDARALHTSLSFLSGNQNSNPVNQITNHWPKNHKMYFSQSANLKDLFLQGLGTKNVFRWLEFITSFHSAKPNSKTWKNPESRSIRTILSEQEFPLHIIILSYNPVSWLFLFCQTSP